MIIFFSWASTALADDKIPNIVGKWSSISKAVLYGKLDHSKSTDKPVFLDHTAITLVIEKQHGRRFYGSFKSAKTTEMMVGFIDLNNRDLYMVDLDGIIIAELRGENEIYLRYLEASSDSLAAVYATYKREKRPGFVRSD